MILKILNVEYAIHLIAIGLKFKLNLFLRLVLAVSMPVWLISLYSPDS